jgi:hypothetical protein
LIDELRKGVIKELTEAISRVTLLVTTLFPLIIYSSFMKYHLQIT